MELTMESAASKAQEILETYSARQWDVLRQDFDRRMLAGLSEEMLAETDAAITAQVGELVSKGDATTKVSGDYLVVDIPLQFERGELKFRVTLNGEGKMSGIWLLNPDAL